MSTQTNLSAPDAQMRSDGGIQPRFHCDMTPTDSSANQISQTSAIKHTLCGIGTQTAYQSCNAATQTESVHFTPSASQRSETSAHTASMAGTSATSISTQTEIEWSELEEQLSTYRETIINLNRRLGDIVVDDKEENDGEDVMDLSHDEENFSDASDDSKQYDNPFSGKYGYNTNVRIITKLFMCI